ncbi:DUF3158 family protein [Shinella sp.]|uniref:DUF3158 family protein n=1 Tax=Shinella sp. TaxID=1870904 RepID=UPI0025861552|nr:DUF3158 family protein [Shinella sp.]MCW5706911.1 DUF3158 family protein [Shinella sp.]
MNQTRRFTPLEQDAFQALKQSASLKGLLRPFKGKGELEDWANDCFDLRDDLVLMAQRRLLPQSRRRPFDLLPIELAQQSTGAGTTFLRWRNTDRSAMGVALWEALIASPRTPASLIGDLLAMEEQRIVLNMQISLLHSMARQAQTCAGKIASAHAACEGLGPERDTTKPASGEDSR